jgi:hypothetical protein
VARLHRQAGGRPRVGPTATQSLATPGARIHESGAVDPVGSCVEMVPRERWEPNERRLSGGFFYENPGCCRGAVLIPEA